MPFEIDPELFRRGSEILGSRDFRVTDQFRLVVDGDPAEAMQLVAIGQNKTQWALRAADGSLTAIDFVELRELLKNLRLKPKLGHTFEGLLGEAERQPAEIQPDTNTWTLNEGDGPIKETIAVTLNARPAVASAVMDVYVLADTTGSMGALLAEVQVALPIVSQELLDQGVDLAVGVGQYRDFGESPGAFVNEIDPTTAIADAQALVDAWFPGGGGDIAESQLLALHQIAGGAVTWRDGAEKIVLWFGDAPGHEPICAAASGLPLDLFTSTVADDLAAASVTVIATSAGSLGLDADPKPESTLLQGDCGPSSGNPGQATYITDATGGIHIVGIDGLSLADALLDGVSAASNTVGQVELRATGPTAPIVEDIEPPVFKGPYDATVAETFLFEVTFQGNIPCSHIDIHKTGSLDVVVDGEVLASKAVEVQVPRCYELVNVTSNPAAVSQEVWQGLADNNTPPVDVKVFALSDGELVVAHHSGDPTDPDNWDWEKLGHGGHPLVGNPEGLATDRKDVWPVHEYLQAFVVSSRRRVASAWWDGQTWSWVDLGPLNGTRPVSDPAALATRHTIDVGGKDPQSDVHDKARVAIVGADGGTSMYRELANGNLWSGAQDQGQPPSGDLPSSRGAGVSKGEDLLRIDYFFFVDDRGQLVALHTDDHEGHNWQWLDVGNPGVPLRTRLFPAASARQTGPHSSVVDLFVLDNEPEPMLRLMQWDGVTTGNPPQWTNLGAPTGALFDRSPGSTSLVVGNEERLFAGVVTDRGKAHVHAVDVGSPGGGAWSDLDSPPGRRIVGPVSLAPHGYGEVDGVLVFARCNDNFLYMRALTPAAVAAAGWRKLDRKSL